jgi:hypothetical protein
VVKRIGYEIGRNVDEITAIGATWNWLFWQGYVGDQIRILWERLERWLVLETQEIREACGGERLARTPIVIHWQWSRHWTEFWSYQG